MRLVDICVLAGIYLPLVFAPAANAQTTPILSDSVFMNEAERGLHLLYNMKFDRAEAVFDSLSTRYPQHPAVPFMQGLIIWWKILTDLENPAYDKPFARLMQEVIDRSDRRLERDEYDVDGLFFKGLALGLRGRLRSNRRSWYGAARDARAGYKYVVRAAEIDPSNHDYYFGWGMYDYFVDALPADKWYLKVAKLFFKGGDKERGIAELERTFEKGRLLRPEAAYFLLQIYFGYEQNFSKSNYYATWLTIRYPDNSWFQVLHGRVYARWSRWNQALPVFDSVISRWEAGRPGYSDGIAEQAFYYRGRGKLARRELDEAKSDFEQVMFMTERLDRDTVYGILSRLRLGMVHDLQGRRDMALAYYRQVLEMDDRAGAHETVQRYLETPYGRPAYR